MVLYEVETKLILLNKLIFTKIKRGKSFQKVADTKKGIFDIVFIEAC